MTPFEVLYGHRCRTPLNWIEPREKVIVGPDLVKEAEATSSFPRQHESHKVMPRGICKQKVSTP
jgi:hypothetical protein